MRWFTGFPIRLKIVVSMVFVITAVVSVITFTMANFFHEDKSSYVHDWISITVRNVAEESESLLEGYARGLELATFVMLNENIPEEDRAAFLQTVFEKLPDLIEVALYREGKAPEIATDARSLEAAGLTAADLARYRDEHPLPKDAILGGRVYLRNSTFCEDLPSFTLAFSHAAAEEQPPVMIAAVFRLDELMRIGAKVKVFEVVLADEDGTLLAHPDVRRVAAREPAGLANEAKAIHQENRAGITTEINDRGTETIASFAGVDFGEVTVAARVPKAAAYLASRELLSRLVLVGVLLVVFVAIVGRFLARRITRSVERLSEATHAVAKGEFDVQVDVASRDEIGTLALSFNQMATELQTREEALGEAHSQLVQSEKLAAFGQLGAGIAHEVKNPLTGILGCAQLSLMEVEPGSSVHENVETIERETRRCKTIIDNLLKFARQEKAALDRTDVNQTVKDAVAIVTHQLEMNKVRLFSEIEPDLPPILGNGNQLQQVLMNLMINAQQAMEGEPGEVHISTHRAGPERIEIRVRDTGPGIPQEIQSKLFDPFFTTKPAGQGTGLGLSVSFGIIEEHRGEIKVHSEPGEGAEFVIGLPVPQAGIGPGEAEASKTEELAEAAAVAVD